MTFLRISSVPAYIAYIESPQIDHDRANNIPVTPTSVDELTHLVRNSRSTLQNRNSIPLLTRGLAASGLVTLSQSRECYALDLGVTRICLA